MNKEFLDISRDWFVVIKKTKDLDIPKSIKLYNNFLYAWLSLVFLGKSVSIPISPDSGEKSMIKTLLNDVITKNPNFAKNLMSYNNDKVNQLAKLKVENVKPYEGHNSLEEANGLNDAISKKDNDTEILKNLANVLYVIRCNIFHGDKSWSKPRDNEIMATAIPILQDLVENLLKLY